MDKSVCALIVLYNPNPILLKRLYKTLCRQVSNIVFIDNSEDTKIKKEVKQWLIGLNLINESYIDLGKNYGIAHAQNQGIKFAAKTGADFILLLDQDSSLPSDMVAGLLEAYQNLVATGERVAAVGPSFLDEKTGEIAKIIRHKDWRVIKKIPDRKNNYEWTDYIISSGSLISTKTFEEIGNMNEKLFIDWVDIEWCLRAKQKGYSSFVVSKIIMQHSIGDEYVGFGERKINLHTDFRNYFIVRNSIYLSLYSKLPANFKTIQLGKVPQYILFYSFHSKKPLYSLGLLTRAVFDGITKNMGKGYFKDKNV